MHEDNCGALIKHIHYAMQKNVNNQLREDDLTFTQVHLLFLLRGQPAMCCSLKELERQMKLAQSTTAGLVKRCGEKGLIDYLEDTEDRRAKYVRITEKGLSVCADADARVRRSEAQMVSLLTEEETDTLLCLLNKVYNAVSQPESQRKETIC